MSPNQMNISAKVKFQPPETDDCFDASVAWDAGDVQFIHVPILADGRLVRLDVYVARQGGDGIYRRVENYTLSKTDESVLRSLREVAEAIGTL